MYPEAKGRVGGKLKFYARAIGTLEPDDFFLKTIPGFDHERYGKLARPHLLSRSFGQLG